MEVHHQSHSERKKWTHYLWEFFMLFLAVTLGFFVENQREHYSEHRREKEYAGLLYDDLKKDTTSLHRIITIKEWRGKKMDSLFYFMSLPDLQKNANSIYYYSAFLPADIPFTPNDATIQQLRNSGSLRYFSNLRLYNAITQYYSTCSFYLERQTERKSNFPIELRAKIFRADEFYSFTRITPDIMEAIHYPRENMQLLSTDKQVINEFIHYAKDVKMANDLSIMLLQTFIAVQLNELIIALKKEFHLE
jgi:hypothetical protein